MAFGPTSSSRHVKGRSDTSNDTTRRIPRWKEQLKDIPADDLADIKRVFVMYDKDNDGTISSRELKEILNVMGNYPTQKYMRNVMREADKDGNGKLDFDEFALLLSKYLKPQAEEEMELQEAFSVFDKDNSGTIEIGELKEILKIANEHIPDEQLQKIFTELDVNGDGSLDYKEFTRIATKRCFQE